MKRQRLAMVIEYNGSKFHGWQKQDNAFTVQEAMQDAILKIEGSSVPQFAAAGRTDAGVHATHMLIHADVSLARWKKRQDTYIKGMNFHLRDCGVLIHGVKAVPDDFHARFDCFERRYQYKIWNRGVSSALFPKLAWWVLQPLDIQKMKQASKVMLGEHDFSTFRAAGCQANSAMRTLKTMDIKQDGCLVTIDVAADAFLYHMVRNIVGTLVAVGIGRWEPDHVKTLLDRKNRCEAAQTAPAHGLYFSDAIYRDFSAQSISGLVG